MRDNNRKRWTDELVESEIRELSKQTGMFPTNTELVQLGRGDLSNQICKRGGYRAWSEKLGITRAPSDSDFGWHGESAFASLCARQNLSAVRSDRVKAPWDMIVEGSLRVDVKNATYAEYGACRGWFYRMGKAIQADIAILHQDDTGNFYAVPWWLCPTSNITISRGGGKYAEYFNNWSLIRQMLGMRMAERARFSPEAVAEVA